MSMVTGVINFVDWFGNAWFIIILLMVCGIGIYRIKKSFEDLSTEEKWILVQDQIIEIILKLVADAEEDYKEWAKAGSIKRSQVIKQLYEQFPVLSVIANQEDVIEWIDKQIDNALVTLREIIEINKKKEEYIE